MSNFNPAVMTTEELVNHFAGNGAAQSTALLYDEIDEYNRLFDEMWAIKKELTARGTQARMALLSLYGHKNMQVRLQAAQFTLAVAPVAARNELQAVADSRCPPQCFDAKGAISSLDDGTYKPT
jgi:hypothetical protein